MATPYKLGDIAVLYYSATPVTSTTYTVASTKADNIKNAQISLKTDSPEYTTRANAGIKQHASSLKDMTISFEILVPGVGATDAAYSAFRTAYTTGADIAIYALDDDKDTAGAWGPAGNFVVTDFSAGQNVGEVQFKKVELKPSTFNGFHTATGS
jgi:hypothetical protein